MQHQGRKKTTGSTLIPPTTGTGRKKMHVRWNPTQNSVCRSAPHKNPRCSNPGSLVGPNPGAVTGRGRRVPPLPEGFVLDGPLLRAMCCCRRSPRALCSTVSRRCPLASAKTWRGPSARPGAVSLPGAPTAAAASRDLGSA